MKRQPPSKRFPNHFVTKWQPYAINGWHKKMWYHHHLLMMAYGSVSYSLQAAIQKYRWAIAVKWMWWRAAHNIGNQFSCVMKNVGKWDFTWVDSHCARFDCITIFHLKRILCYNSEVRGVQMTIVLCSCFVTAVPLRQMQGFSADYKRLGAIGIVVMTSGLAISENGFWGHLGPHVISQLIQSWPENDCSTFEYLGIMHLMLDHYM